MSLVFTKDTTEDQLTEHLTQLQPTWNVTSHFLAMLLHRSEVLTEGTVISINDEGYLDFKRSERK